MLLSLLAAAALVAANGFFVATEFSLARLRPTQVEDLIQAGKPGARSVRHAVDHIDAYLAACQLGITLASLGLGVVGKPAFTSLLEGVLGEQAALGGVLLAGALAFGIITVLHVVVGELAPKSLAISNTAPVALVLSPLMRAFYLATKPVVDLFNAMGNLLLKPFGVVPAAEAGHAPHSEDELRELLRQSSREGMIDAGEQQLSDNVLIFGDRRAREAMTPRPEVDVLHDDDDLAAAIAVVRRTGRTRLPLCTRGAGLDDVIGMVNAKDLLGAAEGATLSDLARELMVVPDGERLDRVLRDMRRRRLHLALVVEEHGTAIGLLTMEDVLEEIVGEIEDEYDQEHGEPISREGDGWHAAGDASLRVLADEAGIALPAGHESTVGGHLIEQLGRVPEPGERVTLVDRAVEVLEVDDARILAVRVAGAED